MLWDLIWIYFGKAFVGSLGMFAGVGITGYSGYLGYKKLFKKNTDYIWDWVRHIFIYGTTGSGKTTVALKFFLKLISDVRRFGTLFISPDVKTTNRILSIIPDWREEDAIIVNATDKMPIGSNLAFSGDIKEHEINLYADDIVEMIKHLYRDNAWGDLIEEGVRMAAFAILEYKVKSKDKVSLLDVMRFLKDEDYREKVLGYVENYLVEDYWRTYNFENADYKKLVIRFRKPLVSPFMLECLCQENNFNLIDAVNNNKIIILQLGGTLGKSDSKLLASMFFSKFYRAVESERINVDFFQLYCDEMHLYLDLLGDNMAESLATIRKYHISLVLITQAIYQLTEKLKGAIGLCNTKYVFPPVEEDIPYLVRMFKDYEIKAKSLIKLKTGQSLSVELTGGVKNDPKFQYHPMVESSEYPTEKSKRIRELSRQKYGTPRKLVKEYVKSKFFGSTEEKQKEPVKDEMPIDNVIPMGGKKNDNRKGHKHTPTVGPYEVP